MEIKWGVHDFDLTHLVFFFFNKYLTNIVYFWNIPMFLMNFNDIN